MHHPLSLGKPTSVKMANDVSSAVRNAMSLITSQEMKEVFGNSSMDTSNDETGDRENVDESILTTSSLAGFEESINKLITDISISSEGAVGNEWDVNYLQSNADDDRSISFVDEKKFADELKRETVLEGSHSLVGSLSQYIIRNQLTTSTDTKHQHPSIRMNPINVGPTAHDSPASIITSMPSTDEPKRLQSISSPKSSTGMSVLPTAHVITPPISDRSAPSCLSKASLHRRPYGSELDFLMNVCDDDDMSHYHHQSAAIRALRQEAHANKDRPYSMTTLQDDDYAGLESRTLRTAMLSTLQLSSTSAHDRL
jgi:hypothetical protein